MVTTYVKPQVLVFQEFQEIPASITAPLRAHISGPNADLHRYSEDEEKLDIGLGNYDPTGNHAYSWPGRNPTSLIDLKYTKVFLDGALLRYFEDLTGIASVIAPVASRPNRIRSDTVAFAANGDEFPRDDVLLERDVQPGDTAYVRGSIGSETYELWSYVKDLIGEAVDSVIDDAAADEDNAASQVTLVNLEKIGGADNCVDPTADGTAYDGLEDGDIEETYTIEVTSGSINGDHTTARLRVTSASGNDDVSSVAPAAVASPTTIGTRGLEVTFDILNTPECSAAAEEDDVGTDDLIVGQKWRVTVRQAFTPVTFTSDGDYTGVSNTTYIVEVTKGGLFADEPMIVATTTTGIDISGPTAISASATATPIGIHGVTITFTGAGLRKGDKYYIPVTAEGEGALQTIILGHDLPEEIQDAVDLDLRLYITKDIEVDKNRIGFAPLTNWAATEDDITINSGMVAYDSSWTEDGVEQPLDIEGGSLYVEYREWIGTLCHSVESIDASGDLDDIPGPLHPDNPLKWGVYKALANANNTEVRYTAVCDPDDLSSWADLIEVLVGRDDIYSLAPMTFDRRVQDMFAAHVTAQSTETAGRWRGCFITLPAHTSKAVVNDSLSDDSEVVLATLEDDPNSSGTQYTLLKITSGNVELLTNQEVRAGDTVRFLFTTDGFDGVSYTEFTIEEVLTEQSLLLSSGHGSAINVGQKVEIWRNLRKSEVADDIVFRAGSFANRRVCVVWPDVIRSADEDMAGYYVCAALAGLRSGVPPHQSLTRVAVSGFDDVSRTSDFFNHNHLDTLAGNGIWIVTQDPDGSIYTRHGLTTDMSDINHSEEMVRANVDAMSYVFLRDLSGFVGQTNVTESALTVMRVQVEATIEFLKSNSFTQTLGGQLIDGDIVRLSQHATLRDRVVIILNLTIPYPLNIAEVHLVI